MLILLLAGCFPDDWDGSPYRPGDTGAPAGGTALAGGWLSEGGDLSALFAGDPFHYVRVESDFGADGAYVVTSVDRDGAEYVLTGTYTVDEGTDPATITLLQSEPYEAEAEGIWQVDGDALTWETVQTLPDYGFVPPTPESGFGSTSGPGLEAGANVQVYRSVP